MKNKLVLVRHGQSEYNKDDIFTGWRNPPLTEQGCNESIEVAKVLQSKKINFDVAFTSSLLRAQDTLSIIMKNMANKSTSTIIDSRLNEKHYGILQGKSKKFAIDKYGVEQVEKWRRGYDEKPPDLDIITDEEKFENTITPLSESLADVEKRVLDCYYEKINPILFDGGSILVVAHGNSLRSLIMKLDKMSKENIEKFNIPNGGIMAYDINPNGHLIHPHFVLL